MFHVGDEVIYNKFGVRGVVVKQYYPTASAQQTLIKTDDGRLFHAPTSEFVLYKERI